MSSRQSMFIHAATLVIFFTASNAPTPLYPIYQAQWGLSTGMLTLVFGVYPIALLCTLLVGGKLSDYLGRRPVILTAIVIMLFSLLVMSSAQNIHWLITARIVQGVATGLGAVALNAVLIDIDAHNGTAFAPIAPSLGGAIGAFGTAGLIQLAPAPMRLVFILLLVGTLCQLILTLRTKDTVQPRPGAVRSLRPSVVVPHQVRGDFLAISPFNIALWAQNAFFMALMPLLMARLAGSNAVWLSGFTVATVTLSGVAGSLAARRAGSLLAFVLGCAIFTCGIGLILVASAEGSGVAFLVGCILTGAGGGCGYLGALRSVLPAVDASQRGGVMAAIFVEGYLANSLPPITAGYLARTYDLMMIANIYGVILMLLTAGSVGGMLWRKRDGSRLAKTSEIRNETRTAETWPAPLETAVLANALCERSGDASRS